MSDKSKKSYISVAELAERLGLSRVAVFNRIKKGQIPAEKIGRSYAISMEDAEGIVGGTNIKILAEDQKEAIRRAVEKTVKEYGETLKLLGKE